MTGYRAWKMAGVVALLFTATAIASHAQTFTTLLMFHGPNGETPQGESLVQGRDGALYGTTDYGGANNEGTVFRLARTGKLTVLHSFCSLSGCADGTLPVGGLLLGNDGNFYGTTWQGGDPNCGVQSGCGTVFRISPSGSFLTIHTFELTDGAAPFDNNLIQAIDGNFYGATALGGNLQCRSPIGCGTIFKINSTGKFATLYEFSGTDGSGPSGLIQASNGTLYGGTYEGGNGCNQSGCGTIFSITTGGTLTTLYDFTGQGADGPQSSLIQAADGNLYGTTEYGGTGCSPNTGCGTTFSITLAGSFTTLYEFDAITAAFPYGGLIQATDGNFYGTTAGGGNTICQDGCGTLFQMTSSDAVTILVAFDGGRDGLNPYTSLFQATNGTIYGLTSGGGDFKCLPNYGCGTIFSLDMGLGPFVSFVRGAGRIGETDGILGQGFTGTTSVAINGIQAQFKVVSDTYLTATVPPGAATGYVTVTTPSGTLTSNVPFRVIP